jgi:hypothetical protein
MMGRGTAAAAAVFCLFVSLGAHALDIKIVENQMILSGPIEIDDAWTFSRAVANNPQIDTIVLRDMPGGKVESMRRMVSVIEDRRLNTIVSRSCRSACAVIFLAGQTRRFSDDYPPQHSYLGFHSGYRSSGSLKGFVTPPASNEHVWFVNRTGGKLDPELAKRWLNLEHISGLAYFYHPAAAKVRSAPSYLCLTNMPVEQCEKIEKSSFDYGMITSDELAHVNDAPRLEPNKAPFWEPERYSKVAPISMLQEAKFLNDGEKKTVESYRKKDEPKALFMSEDGKWFYWSSNKAGPNLALYFSITNCQEKSQTKCHVIAVGDDLVLSPAAIQARKFD